MWATASSTSTRSTRPSCPPACSSPGIWRARPPSVLPTTPAYIVAHKQIITDRAELSALIDSNIAFIHRKERELLDDLTDGMTFSDWIYAFCQRENIRTRQELKFSIVERNFANFVDWLTDTGKVRVERDFCAKRYYHG